MFTAVIRSFSSLPRASPSSSLSSAASFFWVARMSFTPWAVISPAMGTADATVAAMPFVVSAVRRTTRSVTGKASYSRMYARASLISWAVYPIFKRSPGLYRCFVPVTCTACSGATPLSS